MRVTTPTRAQIEDADPILDPLTQSVWATLIKQSGYYASNLRSFVDLEARLAGVTGIKAQQLNAALNLIEALPGLDAEIKGDDEATHFSVPEQRATYVNYGISVLWDVPLDGIGFNQRRYSNSVRTEATM